MPLSIFLSKLFGLYFLIVFILLAYRKEEFIQEVQSFFVHTGSLMLAGALNLIGGLAILIGHPVWRFQWETIITLLGLLMLIKGIIRLGYPRYALKWEQKFIQRKRHWNWMMAFLLVLGIFLTYQGLNA